MGQRYVEVTWDKQRTLEYTIDSLIDVEDVLGHPLGKTLLNLRSIGLKDLRAIVWGGLKNKDKEITLKGTGEALDLFFKTGGDIAEVWTAVDLALTRSGVYGPPEKVEADLLSKKSPGNGAGLEG